MDDYRLHLQAGSDGERAWFWRLDDAAGLQIAADWADSLDDVWDRLKTVSRSLNLAHPSATSHHPTFD